MSEVRLFLNAVQFLTRWPIKSPVTLDEDWLLRTAKYFPAVGIFIGCASALVFLCASMIWTGAISAILTVAASIAMTGAFHEDGLADTADGLGGGLTCEARLAIMKDSRIGTYGALALIVSTLVRVSVLASLPLLPALFLLIAAHAVARFPPLLVLKYLPHAGDASTAKVSYIGSPLRSFEIMVALVFCIGALLPLALISMSAAIVGLIGGSLLAIWMARKSSKLVGGYTGDVLGAVEQLFEIGFALGVLAWIG